MGQGKGFHNKGVYDNIYCVCNYMVFTDLRYKTECCDRQLNEYACVNRTACFTDIQTAGLYGLESRNGAYYGIFGKRGSYQYAVGACRRKHKRYAPDNIYDKSGYFVPCVYTALYAVRCGNSGSKKGTAFEKYGVVGCCRTDGICMVRCGNSI